MSVKFTEGINIFDLQGKVAVVIGGGGVLAGAMAAELARRGARVAILDLFEEAAQKVADAMGIGLMEAAEGIIKIVNESMFGALRLVSVEQGYRESAAAIPMGRMATPEEVPK